MKFGKLANVDGVDFALPRDRPDNARVLAGLAARSDRAPPRVLVGTSGWSSRSYVGALYPPGARSREFLALYARAFPANELNSTYYGVDEGRIRRWAASVPEGFRFCPKLPSVISHELELRGAEAEMESFAEALEGFGPALGRVFTVLPPGFAPERLGDLAAFVEAWAPRLELAVELRHEAWYADAGAGRELFALFEANGVTAVLTDVAGRRDVLHMAVTAPDVLVRFVGNALHPSDFVRLDDWTERLGRWLEAGVETAYFFLHQPDDAQTVDLAEHLLPRLAARTGQPLSFTRPAGARQRELFG